MQRSSTILGMGAYIPEQRRGNDYWPESLVKQWGTKTVVSLQGEREKNAAKMHPALVAELERYKDDYFMGTRERRIAPADMLPSEMTAIACEEALNDAGVAAEDVDLLIVSSVPGDHPVPPNVYRVHHRIRAVNARCFELDAACNAFQFSWDVAHAYITSGLAKRVLIGISTKYSSIVDDTSSLSIVAGDGAVAAVIGGCPRELGLQHSLLRTETVFHDALYVTRRAPTRSALPAFEYGPRQSNERALLSVNDKEKASAFFAKIPDYAAEIRRDLVDANGISPEAIALLVVNGSRAYLSAVVAKILGVPLSKVEDNVLEFGNIGPATLPMNLYTAYKKGRLSDGDNVLMFGHGGGASYGGTLFRWHRGERR
ncbi:MAG TPA: 3-oxoacyl-[acyl-carrier-protein] synthase III C-terminal domain-containing protein [Archangium sp.]|nr:3-oxoacyl-[acyl-carrier-protein] synthase III C-terminal domain-containing protein [Archangium sp.]